MVEPTQSHKNNLCGPRTVSCTDARDRPRDCQIICLLDSTWYCMWYRGTLLLESHRRVPFSIVSRAPAVGSTHHHMRPLKPAFALLVVVVVLLLRLSTALSSFRTLNRVTITSAFPPTPPPNTSMKVSSNGGLVSSWRRSNSRPSVLALIGGIASGKSTVSRALGAECGLEVIDADKLGHESYKPGTRCFGRLVDEFGTKIVSGDGTIDRRALGEAVGFVPSYRYQLLYCCRATRELQRCIHLELYE